MIGALFSSLPKPTSVLSVPLRPIIFVLGTLASIIALANSAWLWYTLAKWSSGLSTFRKVFDGLNAIFLILVVLLILYGFFGLVTRSEKKIGFFAHVAMIKFVILGITGLVYIISVAKNSGKFKDDCNQVFANQTAKCNNLQTTHMVLAVVLYIVEEVALFILAMLLKSFIYHTYGEQKAPQLHNHHNNDKIGYNGGNQMYVSQSPLGYA